jgi:putative nucleotidyltransferase with HDIG domain
MSLANKAVCRSAFMKNVEQRQTFTRAFTVIFAIAALSALHFAVAIGTRGLHVVHLIFAVLYLFPLIAAAVWFGLPGALVAATVITAVYYLHIRYSWANQPMENADQYAHIAVYWVVAMVTGMLTQLRERDVQRHLEVERNAERTAMVEALGSLENALRARDQGTRQHSENVAALACRIANRMRLSPDRIELLRLAALVHDIGKIGVRDDVLLKEAALSSEERAVVQLHPVIAADILRPIHNTAEIAEIVLQHHEAPDGSGYPRRLREREIMPEANIVRVADMFTALTEPRPYKQAMSAVEALQFMRPLRGVKIDGPAFDALCAEVVWIPGA